MEPTVPMPPLPCGGGAIEHKSCQYAIYMSSITRARAINKKTRAGQSRYCNNTPALSREKERAQKPNTKKRTLLQKSSSSKTVTTKNLTKLRSHIINTGKERRSKNTRAFTITIIQIIL